jgi:hypothetical protein
MLDPANPRELAAVGFAAKKLKNRYHPVEACLLLSLVDDRSQETCLLVCMSDIKPMDIITFHHSFISSLSTLKKDSTDVFARLDSLFGPTALDLRVRTRYLPRCNISATNLRSTASLALHVVNRSRPPPTACIQKTTSHYFATIRMAIFNHAAHWYCDGLTDI